MLRKAIVGDVRQIHALVNSYARKNLMLPRALNDIYERLQCYFVVVAGKKVIGCAALTVTWDDLAEIRSLAVDHGWTGKGVGRKLVGKCTAEARKIGIKRVFALTFKPDYFTNMGFRVITRDELPHKVWGDCIRCPLFPDCGEVPVIRQIEN